MVYILQRADVHCGRLLQRHANKTWPPNSLRRGCRRQRQQLVGAAAPEVWSGGERPGGHHGCGQADGGPAGRPPLSAAVAAAAMAAAAAAAPLTSALCHWRLPACSSARQLQLHCCQCAQDSRCPPMSVWLQQCSNLVSPVFSRGMRRAPAFQRGAACWHITTCLPTALSAIVAFPSWLPLP